MSSYFSSSGGSSPVAGGTSAEAVVPSLHVATIVAPSTEQSYTLPAGTKWFSIINHDIPGLQVAYTLGQSGSVYRLIPRGSSTVHPKLDSSASVTIYFQAATVGGRLEIESWA